MSVDFRKLKSFVKIVDAGSVSRASSILATAQPALSQQIAALEAHFNQKLLIRSSHGIAPTEAGIVLYRHAQLMLKQIEQAQADVNRSAADLSGRVSVGLATYSLTGNIALPLLRKVGELHPDILVHINDSFGYVLSELIMTGKMDMAVIYGSGPIKGVAMQPLYRQELFLIAPADGAPQGAQDEAIAVSALDGVGLILPSRGHFLRQLVDEAFARARCTPRIIAELESATAIGEAVSAGLGATILPHSAATASAFSNVQFRRLVRPAIQTAVSFCVSDHLPLSEPAVATRAILLDIVETMLRDGRPGVKPLEG